MSQYSKQVIQKIVLGGVVVNKDKVLILQRHDNEKIYPSMWELPSGKREPLEPSEHSLLREIKEETGLDVEILAPISVFDYQIESEGKIKDSTQVNFLLNAKSDEVKLSDEHQAFAWITKKEMEDFNLSEATRKVILLAFDLLKNKYFSIKQ